MVLGLRDLIEAASLLDSLPRVLLVTVSVAELQAMQISLSDEVANTSLPRVVAQVKSLLDELTANPPAAVASG